MSASHMWLVASVLDNAGLNQGFQNQKQLRTTCPGKMFHGPQFMKKMSLRAAFVDENNKNSIFSGNIKYFSNFESNAGRRNAVGGPRV